MTSYSQMQKSGQLKNYHIKENYHQKNSEKGYFYSNSQEMLDYLGLEQNQEVTKDSHYKLADGFNPSTNEALANNSGSAERRAGFDMTNSAPKSFSLICEFARITKDKDLSNLLTSIQKEANLKMMSEASKYALARLNDKKRTRINNVDIISASFEHNTSRASVDGFIDPQEHTHNVIYNIVGYTDENGKYKIASLENKKMRDMVKYLGQVYRSELAKLLNENGLELEIDEAKFGTFNIKGFNEKQLNAFSNRSIEVRAEAQALIDSGALNSNIGLQKAIEISRLKNYKAKKEIDRDELTVDNAIRFKHAGLNDEFFENLVDKSNPKTATSEEKQEFLRRAYESLENRVSIFSMEELKMEFAKQSVHLGISLDEVDSLVIREDEIIKLNPNQYTTKKMIRYEKLLIDNIDTKSFILDSSKERVNEYLVKNKIDLTAGQTDAIELLLKEDNQLLQILGDAGSGKTFAMKVLNDVYKDDFDFVGLAPTGNASGVLEKDSGIQSFTIDSYLLKEKARNDKPRVIILDEAGMVDAIKFGRLEEKCLENGDKLVVIGDDKQFLSVGAGKTFANLVKFGAKRADVTENRRQETEELRDFVDNLKKRDFEKAFKNIEKDIREIKNEKKLIEAMTKECDVENGDVMLFAKNKNKDTANNLKREDLLKEGFLNDDNALKVATYKNAIPNGTEKYLAKTYEIGDILTIDSLNINGFKGGQKLKIVGYADDNTLILDGISTSQIGRDRTAKGLKLNIKDNIDKVSIFTYDKDNEQNFTQNEKIIFTKNIRNKKEGLDFANGMMGTITKVDGNFLTVKTEQKEFTFDAKKYPFFDYSYAITNMKSQGMSIGKVIGYGDDSYTSFNDTYTQGTRGKLRFVFFTKNLKDFIEKAKNEQNKKTTLDYTTKEDFKEKDKIEEKIFKKELLNHIKDERKKFSKTIKNLFNEKGEKDGKNVRENLQQVRRDGKTKSPITRYDDGTKQRINKLIQSISTTFRGIGSRWRKSYIGRIKENWFNLRDNSKLYEAQKRIEQFRKLNDLNRKIHPKVIFEKNGISSKNWVYSKDKLGNFISKNSKTKEVLKNHEIYQSHLKMSESNMFNKYFKDFEKQIIKTDAKIEEKLVDKQTGKIENKVERQNRDNNSSNNEQSNIINDSNSASQNKEEFEKEFKGIVESSNKIKEVGENTIIKDIVNNAKKDAPISKEEQKEKIVEKHKKIEKQKKVTNQKNKDTSFTK